MSTEQAGGDGELWRQASALADPTRLRLYRYLRDADGPVDVAELTDLVGLHHTAVRQHLARLREAGLVDEARQATGRPGRPRLVYRAAGVEPTLVVTDAYRRLSMLLADALRAGGPPSEAVRAAGRAAGRRAAEGVAIDGVTAFEEEARRLGFSPRRVARGRSVELVLERCPFADVAAADPALVCGLHLGLAEGLADAVGGVEVLGLTVRDPHTAGCRLRLRRLPG
ncbi:MAG: helix-turn-helix domain-containing protein [Acidimicrobiales bacterium]|nr:helix-turn-helix domain-containing protein [Acidimicrobiales bacterium]